jgi:hypothetical protein
MSYDEYISQKKNEMTIFENQDFSQQSKQNKIIIIIGSNIENYLIEMYSVTIHIKLSLQEQTNTKK